MPRPDVALISPFPAPRHLHDGPSGVASYSANLVEALSAAGARVTVIAPSEPGLTRGSTAGTTTVVRAFERGPRALPRAVDAALATGAPVVHLQQELFLYGATALPALPRALRRVRRSGRSAVVTMHHVVDPAHIDAAFVRLHRLPLPVGVARRALTTAQASAAREASVVIVHEAAFTQVLRPSVHVPHGLERPGRTIPRAEARARVGIASDRFTVLCFGFVAPYKGLEVAVAAAGLAGDDIDLVVAGGPHPRTGTAYVDRLRAGATGNTRFVGHVPDAEVADWFVAADLALFCYPQPHAASGALALALAYRTPVLLSPALAALTGASPELVAPHEPAALAQRLVALAADPDAVARLTGAASALATGRSWADVAIRHLDIYRGPHHDQHPARRRLRATQSG